MCSARLYALRAAAPSVLEVFARRPGAASRVAVLPGRSFVTGAIGWSDTTLPEANRIVLPLGSNEQKVFIVPPAQTVAAFLKTVEAEAGCQVKALIDGVLVSGSIAMNDLAQSPFELCVGDNKFTVNPLRRSTDVAVRSERLEGVENARALLRRLCHTLHVTEDSVAKEMAVTEVKDKLTELKTQLEPMERLLDLASKKAERRMNFLVWGGLGLWSMQFGILFRMTYWEYSWDIVEPMSYFITTATGIAAYTIFVFSQRDFEYRSLAERKYIQYLHRGARKAGVDINRYNLLRSQVADLERRLKGDDGKNGIETAAGSIPRMAD